MMNVKDIQNGVRQVSDGMFHAGRNAWLIGLGMLAGIERLSRDQMVMLTDKGSATGERLRKALGDLAQRVPFSGQRFNDLVKQGTKIGWHRLGIPSQSEINALIERVEQLTQKIEEMKDPV